MPSPIADFIINELSEDAYFWRMYGYVQSSLDDPIRLFIKFANPLLPYQTDIINQFSSALAEPYLSTDFEKAATIVAAASEQEADLVLECREEAHWESGYPGLSCEIKSRGTQTLIGVDWYPLALNEPSEDEAD